MILVKSASPGASWVTNLTRQFFWTMKIGLVPKCSKESSEVRDQGTGVGGQRSGVKTGVTI